MKSDKLKSSKKKEGNPFLPDKASFSPKSVGKKHDPLRDLQHSIDNLNKNIELMAKNNRPAPEKVGMSYKVVRDSNGLIDSFTVMG